MVSRIDIGPDGGPYVAINENSNDLELQDINGDVIAKWDETAGQWDLNNNSLTGINAIDASSANVDKATIVDGTIDSGDVWVIGTTKMRSDTNYSTTDTTYSRTAFDNGMAPTGTIPDGTTLVANYLADLLPDEGETMSSRPNVSDAGADDYSLTEVEIQTPTAGERAFLSSGWTEITSLSGNHPWSFRTPEVKVSGGTGEIRRATLVFGGRF